MIWRGYRPNSSVFFVIGKSNGPAPGELTERDFQPGGVIRPGGPSEVMRAIWKGSISFGLVNIPISLYPATHTEELKFRLLRSKDLSPVNYKRVAEADGKAVPTVPAGLRDSCPGGTVLPRSGTHPRHRTIRRNWRM